MNGKLVSIMARIAAAQARIAGHDARNLSATSSEFVPIECDVFYREADALESMANDALEIEKKE